MRGSLESLRMNMTSGKVKYR